MKDFIIPLEIAFCCILFGLFMTFLASIPFGRRFLNYLNSLVNYCVEKHTDVAKLIMAIFFVLSLVCGVGGFGTSVHISVPTWIFLIFCWAWYVVWKNYIDEKSEKEKK